MNWDDFTPKSCSQNIDTTDTTATSSAAYEEVSRSAKHICTVATDSIAAGTCDMQLTTNAAYHTGMRGKRDIDAATSGDYRENQ